MDNEALAKLPIIPVPMALNEKFPSENEAIQALGELGCVTVPKQALSSLLTVGRYVHGAGAIPMAKGDVMVTQQLMHGAMRACCEEIMECRANIPDLRERATAIGTLAKSLGYLAAKKTEAQKLMLELVGGKDGAIPQDDMAPRVRGFTPGSEVKPAQTLINTQAVHFHSSEAPATAK